MRSAGPVVMLAAALTHLPGHAASDLDAGRQLYEQRCGGCHSIDTHRVGPAHRGVFGRKAGTAAGFAYSPAVLASTVVWNEKTLDAWLADPQRLIPGQRMFFQVDDVVERQRIIGFLATLQP